MGLSPLDQAKLLAEASLIAFGQNIVEGVTAVGREAGMKIRPVSLALEIGIDSRKRTGHGGPSFRILGVPLESSLSPREQAGSADGPQAPLVVVECPVVHGLDLPAQGRDERACSSAQARSLAARGKPSGAA